MNATHAQEVRRLIRALGGYPMACQRVNALRERLDWENGQRPLTERAMREWPKTFPVGWRVWMLAAAVDAGYAQEEAVAICSALKVAKDLAEAAAKRRAAA